MYATEMFDDREMRGWENKTPANQTWREAKSYFVKIYKIKEKSNEKCATRTGGYESANILASRTRSADANVVSNASSKPPTNITINQMSLSDQQTIIEYINSLELELDNAKKHAASMTTTQKTLLQCLEDQQKVMLAQQDKLMAIMNNLTTKTDEEIRQRNNRQR